MSINNKTKITIKDKTGSRTHYFSENFITELKFVFCFFLIFIAFLGYVIYKLKDDNTNLKLLNKELFNKNSSLEIRVANLNANVDEAQKQLEITSDKIEDLQLEVAYNAADNDKEKKPIEVSKKLTQSFFKNIPNGKPLPNIVITDNYGMRVHPISGATKMHHGIDLRASIGTPVYATADGFVEYSANSSTGYGYLVIISHNYGFNTRYGHLYNKEVVKAGQWVRKGDLIGYSGNTGYSTGPHLHYEVRFLERSLNPINFIRWNQRDFSNIFTIERGIPWRSLAFAVSSDAS